MVGGCDEWRIVVGDRNGSGDFTGRCSGLSGGPRAGRWEISGMCQHKCVVVARNELTWGHYWLASYKSDAQVSQGILQGSRPTDIWTQVLYKGHPPSIVSSEIDDVALHPGQCRHWQLAMDHKRPFEGKDV